MKRVVLGICLIFMGGCMADQVKITGQLEGGKGEVMLLTLQPVSGDTMVIRPKGKGEKVKWELNGLHLPAKVWLQDSCRIIADFIVDKKRGMRIKGNLQNDSILIEGGKLEEEYKVMENVLKERFENPVGKLEDLISHLQGKAIRTAADEADLKRYQWQKQRYLYYRQEYIKQLIQANLSHELSLVLIAEELKDSIGLQRQFFKKLTVPDRKSNMYRVLEKKLQ